jgi:trans-resveratrol di-O-methyltransferase
VLHDWDDKDCVKILTQCRKAINPGGKVIILDIVIGSSPAKEMLQAQLELDLLMMVVTSGKERDEQQWRKLFIEAGFSQQKTRPIAGFTSITQLYL